MTVTVGADDGGGEVVKERTEVSAKKSVWQPQIIVTKKRRRKVPSSETNDPMIEGNCTKKKIVIPTVMDSKVDQTKKETAPINNTNNTVSASAGAGIKGNNQLLGGLLGDYGS